MKSKPLWKFWYHLSTSRAIENIENDMLQKEVDFAKADILEAKLELKNSSSHHQFFKSAQHKLEIGAIEPHHIKKLMILAKQGQKASELSQALFQLSNTSSLTT
ncbi:MAG: hypothetical protein WCN86_02470 [bacterium]